jgi:hypothetical protein
MKLHSCIKVVFFFFFSAGCISSSFSQHGEWTWMHGSDTVNSAGNFGIQGVSSPTNVPPPLYPVSGWTDAQGKFWLFGGGSSGVPSGSLGDVWKFDPSINEWTWMHGTATSYAVAVYGTMGVPSPANSPGSDQWCHATWVDNNGLFWLFGGGSAGGTSLLWTYNPLTNEWTWKHGPTTFTWGESLMV